MDAIRKHARTSPRTCPTWTWTWSGGASPGTRPGRASTCPPAACEPPSRPRWLHARLGVEIPEADYGKVDSLDALVDYLSERKPAG
jgi:hypothetical protein